MSKGKLSSNEFREDLHRRIFGEKTVASGLNSHAEGNQTSAVADGSHAEGFKTSNIVSIPPNTIIMLTNRNETHDFGSGATTVGTKKIVFSRDSNPLLEALIPFVSSSNIVTVALRLSYTRSAPQVPMATEINATLELLDTTIEVRFEEALATSSITTKSFNLAINSNLITASYSHAEGIATQTSHMGAHAEGYKTVASGAYSHAEGRDNTASGEGSHVEGIANIASGTGSHAEGTESIASGNYSHAEGWYSEASGQYSHAEGSTTKALGQSSHAEGLSTTAKGNNSHAEGYLSSSEGVASHAEGRITKAMSDGSHAEGTGSIANGISSHAEGNGTIAVYGNSVNEIVAFDNSTKTLTLATMIGLSTSTDVIVQVSNGLPVVAKITDIDAAAKTVKLDTTSLMTSSWKTLITSSLYEDAASHAEGSYTSAIGQYSHAEGSSTEAFGTASHAEGWGTKAVDLGSHAEGVYTKAEIDAAITYTIDPSFFNESSGILQSMTLTWPETSISHQIISAFKSNEIISISYYNTSGVEAFADYTINTVTKSSNGDGTSTFVINFLQKTLSDFSYFDAPYIRVQNLGKYLPTHAEGYNTIASGPVSHAEGVSTNATEIAAHAEGEKTTASGFSSHAEGFETTASGRVSHAEGDRTIASGMVSHAEGFQTKATGQYAHAEGQGTESNGTASHAEGLDTIASNPNSHAEGFATKTRGFQTIIPILRVDNATKTIYTAAHVAMNPGTVINIFANDVYRQEIFEVTVVSASNTGGPNIVIDTTKTLDTAWDAVLITDTGRASHAEGGMSAALASYSHAEGEFSYALGLSSHAEGQYTAAIGSNSHAEGQMTKAYGIRSHAEGVSTKAYGESTHVEGAYSMTGESLYVTAATGTTITLESNNLNPGDKVGWIGYTGGSNVSFHSAIVQSVSGTTATLSSAINLTAPIAIVKLSGAFHPKAAHAEGSSIAAGSFAHSEGVVTRAYGIAAHAEGSKTTAFGDYSHTEGLSTVAMSHYSHAEGQYTIVPYSMNAAHIMGNFGTAPAAGSWSLANGAHPGSQGLAAKILSNGQMFADGAYSSSGADYAELFEWADFNPDNEDRVGYFVTLDGEHIRKATSTDDYILGVVSANPSVVGDNQDLHWKGRFLRDEWGRVKYENVEIPEEIKETIVGYDENENPIIKSVVIPARIERQPMVNPEWNPDEYYARRERRPEWNAIGMMGKLLVRDDGTAEANGYVLPNDEGIATKSDTGYRVMKRMSDNIVMILIK